MTSTFLLSLILLTRADMKDQFDRQIAWSIFRKVPMAIICGTKQASDSSRKWGEWIQNEFNGSFVPRADSLQTLNREEKIKVIAVAILPEVGGFFQTLFRSAFQKQSPDYGIGLDFGGTFSQRLSALPEDDSPTLVLVPPWEETTEEIEAKAYTGTLGQSELKGKVQEQIRLLVTH